MGSVFGAVVGALLCILYRYGASNRVYAYIHDDSLATWAINSAYFFGAIGFAFEYRAADALGSVFAAMLHLERGQEEKIKIPGWFMLCSVVFIAYLIWYYFFRI
jgi:hypothetical protein